MKSCSEMLKALQAGRFLTGKVAKEGRMFENISFLPNGERYIKQIRNEWERRIVEGINIYYADDILATPISCPMPFISSPEFCQNVVRLNKKIPGIIRTRCICKGEHAPPNSNAIFRFHAEYTNGGLNQLTSDLFVVPSNALEKFYKLQREHKIWWMRLSANPSRYFLEAIDLSNNGGSQYPKGTQAVAVKSRFPFGSSEVERITLVPLHDSPLQFDDEFIFRDKRTGNKMIPTVIRSAVNLEAATCALLFDGFDNGRHKTLLLNRRLVPFQCNIACLHRDKSLETLRDLFTHLLLILRRSGLRVFDEAPIFTSSRAYLEEQLHDSDSLGIPYTIVIREDTLRTGLLKLRSRDTTVEETIHISDIPRYLLGIFTC